MLVTVEDGRAVDVRGDPEHPFTRGGLCVKVNNYEQRVYSPERLLYPLAEESLTPGEDLALCEAFEEADREAEECHSYWAGRCEAA
jgi:hypothetical protein